MSHTLESGALETPNKNKKEVEGKDEYMAENIEEIAGNLKSLEETGIYYPFNYETILSLYKFRDTPEGKELINEKQGVLKQIVEAIEREKELKYWFPSESNDEIISVLGKLIGKSSEAEKEPTKH